MGMSDRQLSILMELYKRNIEHALEHEDRDDIIKELRELLKAIDEKFEI